MLERTSWKIVLQAREFQGNSLMLKIDILQNQEFEHVDELGIKQRQYETWMDEQDLPVKHKKEVYEKWKKHGQLIWE